MSATLRLRASAVAWSGEDGEAIGLDLQSSGFVGVNRSGSVLWTALAEGATRAELISLLAQRFDLDDDRATSDVDSFLAALRERDYLES